MNNNEILDKYLQRKVDNAKYTMPEAHWEHTLHALENRSVPNKKTGWAFYSILGLSIVLLSSIIIYNYTNVITNNANAITNNAKTAIANRNSVTASNTNTALNTPTIANNTVSNNTTVNNNNKVNNNNIVAAAKPATANVVDTNAPIALITPPVKNNSTVSTTGTNTVIANNVPANTIKVNILNTLKNLVPAVVTNVQSAITTFNTNKQINKQLQLQQQIIPVTSTTKIKKEAVNHTVKSTTNNSANINNAITQQVQQTINTKTNTKNNIAKSTVENTVANNIVLPNITNKVKNTRAPQKNNATVVDKTTAVKNNIAKVGKNKNNTVAAYNGNQVAVNNGKINISKKSTTVAQPLANNTINYTKNKAGDIVDNAYGSISSLVTLVAPKISVPNVGTTIMQVAPAAAAIKNAPAPAPRLYKSKPSTIINAGVQYAALPSYGATTTRWAASPYIGVGYILPLGYKWNIQAAFNGSYLNGLAYNYSVVNYAYGFGVDSNTYSLDHKSMYQLMIPVQLSYKYNLLHCFNLGTGATIGINVLSAEKQFGQATTSNVWGYTKGYSAISPFFTAGYQYNMLPYLALNANYFQGFTDFTDNAMFGSGKDYNSRVQVGVTYLLNQ